MLKRAIYMLVWDATQDASSSILVHWLNAFRTHTPKANILLVGTYCASTDPELLQIRKANAKSAVDKWIRDNSEESVFVSDDGMDGRYAQANRGAKNHTMRRDAHAGGASVMAGGGASSGTVPGSSTDAQSGVVDLRFEMDGDSLMINLDDAAHGMDALSASALRMADVLMRDKDWMHPDAAELMEALVLDAMDNVSARVRGCWGQRKMKLRARVSL